MLGSLKKWVAGNLGGLAPAGDEDRRDEVELAAAALLVELARADFREDPEEHAAIRDILVRYLHQPAEQVDTLLAAATVRADRAVSLHEFTRQLNEQLNADEKLRIVEMLWRVSLADRRIDAHEHHLIRKVADLLHVRERDMIRLKIELQEDRGKAG